VCDDKVGNLPQKIQDLTRETAALLKLPLQFQPSDFCLRYARVEHAYGVITDAERQAMRLLARTEGIIADPIYTARGLAELFERVREGAYRDDETVVFWHTGGVAGMFGRAADVLA
jgi:1-aminocyclopropane-1-carboxylate deaminase/D-cysteine desulfhydrase-like pyridoxal-dependent ACC family enzyme